MCGYQQILLRRVCEAIEKQINRAGVAQLVEHHVANVIVVGSSPITRSIFIFYGRGERIPKGVLCKKSDI